MLYTHIKTTFDHHAKKHKVSPTPFLLTKYNIDIFVILFYRLSSHDLRPCQVKD